MSESHNEPANENRMTVLLRNYPLLPLLVLLLGLVGVLELVRPGIVSAFWLGNLVKFAIPLAMLAACQTLTMLTGGIDLSTGIVATLSAFVIASLTPEHGAAAAIAIAMLAAMAIGLMNGFGTGVAGVHPLIMTLGTGLIATGALQVYQRTVIASGSEIPAFLVWMGTGRSFGLPNGLALFVPFAAVVLLGLRYTGFGRLLFAMGSNEHAARLSGVRGWQVHLALYTLSAVIAAAAGMLYLGMIRTASLSLALPLLLPSVAAAVIGGTSIFGGRGSYAGTILGALILQVLGTLLTLMDMDEGARRVLFGLIILLVTTFYTRITDSN